MESALDSRMRDVVHLAEMIWWTLAKNIVRHAGELYKWTDEDWTRAQDIFLRNNDYKVVVS